MIYPAVEGWSASSGTFDRVGLLISPFEPFRLNTSLVRVLIAMKARKKF